MLSNVVRSILVLLALFVGGFYLVRGDRVGLLYVGAGALLIWSYLKTGTVGLAFRAYDKGDLIQMKRHLRATKYPSLLNAQSKAYYDMLQGIAFADDERLTESYACLLSASKVKLRTTNIQSALEAHLADVAIQLGDTETAVRHVSQARMLAHRPELDPFIDAIEQRISGPVGY